MPFTSSSERQTNQIDLRTAGGIRTVTVTPGNSVQYVVDAQQARVGAQGDQPGMYNYGRGFILRGQMIVVRSSGGTTPIYADQFPRCLSSIGFRCPMYGTWLDPTIVSGLVAKELLEFFGCGYQFQGVNRQPIPGTDGTYTRDFEIFIPFFQGWNEWGDHFDQWIGWLDEGILEIFVESAAQPFGISGVTITSVTIDSVIPTVPFSEIIIPPISVLRRYAIAASAGSNGPKLTNVGDAGALQGVDDGSRLQAMLFSHQTGGFTGSGTADQITAISMPWRDQAQSTLPWGFFARFLANAKTPRLGFTPSVVDVFDNTPPYSMSGNPAAGNALNDASARYTPLVWDPSGGLISQLQKVKGNYPLDGMTFNTTQTNSFVVYTRELKQLSQAKCSEMLAAMGIDPTKVRLVPKFGRKNFKPVDSAKFFAFPRNVAAATSGK